MAKRSLVLRPGLLALISSLCIVFLAGCPAKQDDQLLTADDLATVSGTVTYQDRPVIHGAIFFFSDKAPVCIAEIAKDGSYQTRIRTGDFRVGVITEIEPRDAARFAKEGPPGTPRGDPSKGGAVQPPDGGGPPPADKVKGGPNRRGAAGVDDPYARYPSLASVKAKMDQADKDILDAVHKQYSDASRSGLTITVERGSQTKNFELK